MGGQLPSVAHPEFVPNPELTRDEMRTLQREIADIAVYTDSGDASGGRRSDRRLTPPEPAAVSLDEAADLSDGVPEPSNTVSDTDHQEPVVVGIDQAFLAERVISAAVALCGNEVVERASAVTPLKIPYIPGLLAFREGGPVLAALDQLQISPDVLILDGSGRIHYRQAGLATHIGVTTETPAVGVAKSLLCGVPDDSVDGRPAEWSTPIRADSQVESADETVIGHAYQSRQYQNSPRINPLYISPGHGLGAVRARDLVAALCGGYKLPEPTRLADAFADELKREFDSQ